MLLTLQYSIVSALMKDYTNYNFEESDDDEDPYFNLGHGDFNEEEGYMPAFVVWAMVGGQLKMSKPVDPEEEGDSFGGGPTHGSLWGHDVTENDYKGRYEPETGRLSIVKPERFRQREIPDIIMKKLESKFKNITEIRVF